MAKKAIDVFRKNVRMVLDAHEMTITDLADKVGTSRPSISFILSGSEGVSINRAERISKALGFKLSDMLSSDFSRNFLHIT